MELIILDSEIQPQSLLNHWETWGKWAACASAHSPRRKLDAQGLRQAKIAIFLPGPEALRVEHPEQLQIAVLKVLWGSKLSSITHEQLEGCVCSYVFMHVSIHLYTVYDKFLCVHIYACVCVSVYICVQAHGPVRLEARCLYQLSCSVTFLLTFWDSVCHWTLGLLIGLETRTSKTQESSGFASAKCWDCRLAACYSCLFSPGFWGIKPQSSRLQGKLFSPQSFCC